MLQRARSRVSRKAVHDPTGRYPQPKQRGPDGRGLCRWCHREVPKGRRKWCSEECIHQYRLETDWNYIRHQVYRRDKGVCVLCGLDTLKAKRVFYFARRDLGWRDAKRLALELGLTDTTLWRQWWEADHIVPRHRGGPDTVDNLRTLCIRCHRHVTKRQARARANRRRKRKLGRRLF